MILRRSSSARAQASVSRAVDSVGKDSPLEGRVVRHYCCGQVSVHPLEQGEHRVQIGVNVISADLKRPEDLRGAQLEVPRDLRQWD